MSRLSGDRLAVGGTVRDGFDYQLQVWVTAGVVVPCGHPESMKQRGPCCPADRYKGQAVASIAGHEVRSTQRQEGEMSAQIMIAYTDMTGLKPTGRMVRRDLNWFPEFVPCEEPKAAVWLRSGTESDMVKARDYVTNNFADKVRVAVYAFPKECKDPLGAAKTKVMKEPKS